MNRDGTEEFHGSEFSITISLVQTGHRVPGTLWRSVTREIVIEAADHQHHSNRRTVLFFAFDSNTRPDSEEDVVERV